MRHPFRDERGLAEARGSADQHNRSVKRSVESGQQPRPPDAVGPRRWSSEFGSEHIRRKRAGLLPPPGGGPVPDGLRGIGWVFRLGGVAPRTRPADLRSVRRGADRPNRLVPRDHGTCLPRYRLPPGRIRQANQVMTVPPSALRSQSVPRRRGEERQANRVCDANRWPRQGESAARAGPRAPHCENEIANARPSGRLSIQLGVFRSLYA
jgi:hypothetical protein